MNFRIKMLLLLVLVSICALIGGAARSISAGSGTDTPAYITTRAELMKALAEKHEVLYVGDIDFDENDIYVQIENSVKIVGKPEGSLLKDAHFSVIGSGLESEKITVAFENITFDGCYEMPEGDPAATASFADHHGDRTNKGCIFAKGFLEFGLTNCTIRNYCTKYGAAMYFQYTDGNVDLGTRAKLTIKNCNFSGNTCERGVLWINGKKLKFEMTDTAFSENTVYSGVAVLGGVEGTAENITVKDNRHVAFAEKNSFPQGGGGLALVNSELLLKKSIIDGNETIKGGGLLITNSKVTLDSCKILNNHAQIGGGLLIESSETTPVYITNCLISGNTAEQEGAVWVHPADQIGIGVPTGIVEFSFCTFENNTSEDEEHLVFHPVILENESTTVGHDGTIDFLACRILDDKVSPSIRDGENYNIVNSDRKGEAVPDEVAARAANGYLESGHRMFAGVNDMSSETKSWYLPNLIIGLILGVLIVITILVLWFKKDRNKEIVEVPVASEVVSENVPQESLTLPVENDEEERIAAYLQKLLDEGTLTSREMDVLKEYLSGKTRTEISETLFISESTVKNHISSIFSKLGVKSRKELLGLAGVRKTK